MFLIGGGRRRDGADPELEVLPGGLRRLSEGRPAGRLRLHHSTPSVSRCAICVSFNRVFFSRIVSYQLSDPSYDPSICLGARDVQQAVLVLSANAL